jgi:DNA-binding MarR family transcriptional regulator
MNTEAEREEALTLEILDAVERDERVSQRHLAQHLGVALGLANSYLKRCVKKGWVKVQQAPANRYLYYLTPKGFAEKSRLTAAYLSASLSFYREAGDSCSRLFDQCSQNGWRRLLLCGASEVAEIATLRSLEREIEIVGIYDPESRQEKFVGRPLWRELAHCAEHDARVLTDIAGAAATLAQLRRLPDGVPLLVPDVLRLEPGSE